MLIKIKKETDKFQFANLPFERGEIPFSKGIFILCSLYEVSCVSYYHIKTAKTSPLLLLLKHPLDRLFSILTPKHHIVVAFAFKILVRNVSAFKKFVKITVVFKQEIFCTAAHKYIWDIFALSLKFVYKKFGIVPAVQHLRRFAETFSVIFIIRCGIALPL